MQDPSNPANPALQHDERNSTASAAETSSEDFNLFSTFMTSKHSESPGILVNGSKETVNHESLAYHAVQGVNRWGLLVDPGAADAVCGSHTLLQYLEQVLWPRGMNHKPIGPGSASFTGIDGLPMRSGLRTKIPINLGPFGADFETDIIGGSGSTCPMLLPNKSLIRNKAVIWFGYYSNGDGLIVLPHPETGVRML
jgi:hypothetical protein